MPSISQIEELNSRFATYGVARIEAGKGNLPKVRVTAHSATADIYLHGAQVTSWCPAGADEVIFLSEHSHWEDGRAIRGGIPICFPWFRAKSDDPKAPAHGFVRTKAWQLDSVEQKGDSAVVTFATESDETTQRWWPHDFRALHRVTVSAELKLELIVTNTGSTPFRFEEALHTYHQVGDVAKIRVAGLDGIAYLDNTDANREKKQQGDIVMTDPIDNAYLNTAGELQLIDPVMRRRIQIEKQNSLTTVVWNPWETGAKSMSDLGADEWRRMACVEASNILSCAVTLAPRAQHCMTATVRVMPLQTA